MYMFVYMKWLCYVSLYNVPMLYIAFHCIDFYVILKPIIRLLSIVWWLFPC